MNYASEIESSIRLLFDSISAGFEQDPEAGQQHVAHWLEMLRASDNPAVQPVAEELAAFQDHLRQGNAAAMGDSFQKLADLTARAALPIHSFQGLGDKVRELSQKLNSAGGNLQLIGRQKGQH